MSQAIDTETGHVHATVDENGVLVITLDRPERKNAMNPEMWAGVGLAVSHAATDSAVRCIVLTGAGGAFCAGGDVKRMAAGAGAELSAEQRIADQQASTRATSGALYSIPKPTIAAIGGAVAGAGVGLALACDLRVAASSAVFTTAFAKVGLSGDYGSTWFLTQLVGTAKAKELFYLSDKIDMASALELGIVNQVAPPEAFKATWQDLAQRLASGPPVALGYMKENINRAVDTPLFEALDAEVVNHRRSAETADHVEGRNAFVERRSPKFSGE